MLKRVANWGWRPRGVLLVALVMAVTAPAHAASGAGVYWTRVSLLKSFFADSDKVSWKRLDVSPAARKVLTRRLGTPPPTRQTVYFGLKGSKVQGVALIDDQIGQHEPITFAVLLGTDGKMKRLEVVAYREARGGEIRSPRFRRQFTGKSPADKMRLGHDVVAISGATISSKAMVVGARRALIMVDELIIKPGIVKVLQVDKSVAR